MSNTGKLTLLPQAGEFRDCYGILYYNVFDVKGRGILHGKEWLAVRDKIEKEKVLGFLQGCCGGLF